MRKFVGVLGLLFLCLGTITPAQGQGDSGFVPYQRLIMLGVNPDTNPRFSGFGDIYSWTPGEATLFRETIYGYNGAPILSPDGTKVAYLSLPTQFFEAIASDPNAFTTGPFPTNIWMMDLTKALDDSDRFYRIADQVTGLPTDAEENTLQRRSTPVWSPDSTQLAWVELDYIVTKFSGRIMVYDTTTDTTHIVASEVTLGYADGGEWGVPDLIGWGNVMGYATFNAGVYPNVVQGDFGLLLDLFDANKHLSSLPVTYFANLEDHVTELRWFALGNQWRLGMHYPNLGWVALDTTTGSYTLLTNPPTISAITGGHWTGHLVRTEPLQLDWYKDNAASANLTDTVPLTFSPEGVPYWLDESGQLSTFGEGVLLPLDNSVRITAVAWTPLLWQTDGLGVSTTPTYVIPTPSRG